MYNLHDLAIVPPGWWLLWPWDINDAGQIVGSAIGADGMFHGFLLTPIDTDFDDDDDTDLDDFRSFSSCWTGPGAPVDAKCERRDIDGNGNLDLVDFRAFRWAFTGP